MMRMLSLWFVLALAGMNGRCSSVIQTTSTAILPYPNFARALHLT